MTSEKTNSRSRSVTSPTTAETPSAATMVAASVIQAPAPVRVESRAVTYAPVAKNTVWPRLTSPRSETTTSSP
ncbi:Uncharacterised protein [Bordetella pertussis]|nr:Uncharacterised protein [Bordetella pertussis]